MAKEIKIHLQHPSEHGQIRVEEVKGAPNSTHYHDHRPGEVRRTTVAQRRGKPGGHPRRDQP